MKLPKMDPMRQRVYSPRPQDEARQQKAAECHRLMAKQGLMLDKQRIFDRWVLRLRRKKDMYPVWTRRGMNADTLLTEMLRWLRKEQEKMDNKSNKDNGTD